MGLGWSSFYIIDFVELSKKVFSTTGICLLLHWIEQPTLPILTLLLLLLVLLLTTNGVSSSSSTSPSYSTSAIILGSFEKTPRKTGFVATFAILNNWPSWRNISICAHILVTSGSKGVAALIVLSSHPFFTQGQNIFVEKWQESEVVAARHLVFVSFKAGMSRNFDCDQELGMKYQESESCNMTYITFIHHRHSVGPIFTEHDRCNFWGETIFGKRIKSFGLLANGRQKSGRF